MKIAIRYYTKGGNTKKLADAISQATGVAAESVEQPFAEDVDILFLCSSVYWAGVDEKVKAFLKAPGHKIGKIVNVSTAALIESTYKQIKSLATEAGIALDKREFHCRGSFAALHRGKPDQNDLENVKKFAKMIVEEA